MAQLDTAEPVSVPVARGRFGMLKSRMNERV
jgi:hypothetical protein